LVQGKWRYATADDQPGEILVPDLDGMVQPITRIEPLDAVKVVGVLQAMDGIMKEQHQNTQKLRVRKKF
jgi:hypothetical protein